MIFPLHLPQTYKTLPPWESPLSPHFSPAWNQAFWGVWEEPSSSPWGCLGELGQHYQSIHFGPSTYTHTHSHIDWWWLEPGTNTEIFRAQGKKSPPEKGNLNNLNIQYLTYLVILCEEMSNKHRAVHTPNLFFPGFPRLLSSLGEEPKSQDPPIPPGSPRSFEQHNLEKKKPHFKLIEIRIHYN